MENRWNDIDKKKTNYWGKIRSKCHSLHRKFYLDYPGIELRLRN
jgi:hypothetical protein